MERMMIDCRRYPNPQGCTLTISGPREDVARAAMAHGKSVHGFEDSLENRSRLDQALEREHFIPPEYGRKVADCRAMPSEIGCSLTFSGREDEVVRAATEHAIADHGHAYTEELPRQIQSTLVDEASGQAAPAPTT